MSGATQRAIAFIALNDVLQPDYRTAVARRVLTFRRQAPLAARERFDAALAPFIRIRSDEAVVVSIAIINQLVETCQREDIALRAVLSLWQLSQQPLARRMREFLIAQQLDVHQFDALDSGFLGMRPQDQMLALVNEFHSHNPAFNTHDIALMLCCIHGYLPGAGTVQPAIAPPAVAPTLDTLPHSRWHAWLEQLRALPIDAPEWDARSVQAFHASVQQLLEQRLHERQAIRSRLEQVLVLLREQATSEIAYFGFDDVPTWDSHVLPLGDAAAVGDAATAFYSQLLAHRSSLQQAPAATRAAQIERRGELDVLEEQIVVGYAQLCARFVISQPEPAPANAAPPMLPPEPMPMLVPPAPEVPIPSEIMLDALEQPQASPPVPTNNEEAELDQETIAELMLTVGGSHDPIHRHDLPAAHDDSSLNTQKRGFFRRR